MKTASKELKSKQAIPTNPEANNATVSQPGPEDGRDQNISPESNSYDPDNGKSNLKGKDHNVEVHRTDEDDTMKSADQFKDKLV